MRELLRLRAENQELRLELAASQGRYEAARDINARLVEAIAHR